MSRIIATLVLFVSLIGAAQAGPARPSITPKQVKAALSEYRADYERSDGVPYPGDNALSAAKLKLGHALFFDPRLSSSKTMSCATCHNPALGWEDGLPFGLGDHANTLGRHSPTILNLAWAPMLFWDGRAASLEEQALGPMMSADEMSMSKEAVLKELNAIRGYKPLFEAAFPGQEINLDSVAKAIATFERTITSDKAPFDHWIEGDEQAISEEAKRGFVLFNDKANCAACHSGWRFTDDGFHDIGLKSADQGRGKLVPGVEALQFAFKTPTLRNIAQRAPYMHDGSAANLEEVIRHYENGFVERDSLSWAMKKFELSDGERHDLVAFLETLTSEDKAITVPVLPH